MIRRLARLAMLAVGEGKAEYTFLAHIKSLYLQRDCGTTLKLKRGLGKGGRGVIEYAIGQRTGTEYDRCIVLLDADTDWDDGQRQRANERGLDVVESNPCLEAWLLNIHGDHRERSTREWKQEFENRFGWPAHAERVYPKHFAKDRLDQARASVPSLDRLLALLQV